MAYLRHSSSLFLISVLYLLCYSGGNCLVVTSVVTSVGDDAVLPCHVGNIDATHVTVVWTRLDLPNDQFVHFQRDGRDLFEVKDPSYVGRTSLFQDEVKKGNVSLKLTRVKPSDEAIYTCRVPEFNMESTVQLKSTVQLIVEPHQVSAAVGKDVVLPCKTDFTGPLTNTTVRWTREDPTAQNVHVIVNGREMPVLQNYVYKDRTYVFAEDFETGNVSLRIIKVKFTDAGLYRCFIASEKVDECVVQLTVESSPVGDFPWWGWLIIALFIIIIIIIVSVLVHKRASILKFVHRVHRPEDPPGDENRSMNRLVAED